MKYKASSAADRHAYNREKQRKQIIALSVAGGLLALVLIAVFISIVLTSCAHSDNNGASAVISQFEEDPNYDPNAIVIDKEKYASTVLGESEDAGQEYIDNTLFIGDSNTYRMMAYGQTTLKNDIGIVGMGVQQVPTTKCVFFEGYSDPVTIPEAVKIMQPQRIIMCFGTNNTNGWTAKTFTEDYKKAIDAIKAAYPAADIIINSIPPVNRLQTDYNISMTTVDEFNLALVELAEKEGCKFLNSTEVLRDSTGYAKDQYTIQDGIHLTKRAFTEMFDYIRTHSYITEDDRPKPLNKVPNRAETEPYVIGSDPHYTYGASSSRNASSSSGIQRTVTFKVNDVVMGTISGTTEQKVYSGDKCTTVTAVAAEGYKFSHWGCTVGTISDVKNKELTFTPPVWTDEDVIVIAYFVKDESSSSSQISSAIESSSAVSSSSQESSSQVISSSSQPQSSSTEPVPPESSTIEPPPPESSTIEPPPPESSTIEPPAPETSNAESV